MTTPNRFTLRVARTAHYALIGDPNAQPDQCWYVCHGYGQLAHRFLRRFRVLDAPSRWVVAPEGLSRYYVEGSGGKVGASWMTKEDRDSEIADYVAYLNALHVHLHGSSGGDGPEVVILGFSQGCATASRWAARGAVDASRLILWAEVQAHDLTETDLNRLRDAGVRIQFVIGRDDPAVSVKMVEAAAGRLVEAGMPVAVEVFDGGHELDGPTLLRVGEVGIED